jgi:hypothetical protein
MKNQGDDETRAVEKRSQQEISQAVKERPVNIPIIRYINSDGVGEFVGKFLVPQVPHDQGNDGKKGTDTE